LGKKLIAVILWSTVIAILSLMPSSNVPGISWGSGIPLDKIAHIVLYAIYTFLLGRYLTNQPNKNVSIRLWSLAIPIFYGILMEVLQYYLSPSRFFDMLDIIANISGSIVGLLLLKVKILN
jgi:VanZ family protein